VTSVLHPTDAVTPPVGIEGWVNGLTNKPMTKEANGLNQSMAKEVPEKKSIGLIYQCVNCSSDYSARTVWQKKCPVCSSKTRQEVLTRKQVKFKGNQ